MEDEKTVTELLWSLDPMIFGIGILLILGFIILKYIFRNEINPPKKTLDKSQDKDFNEDDLPF